MSYNLILLLFVGIVFGDTNATSEDLYHTANKVVVITGAARGIGYAMADQFLSHNVKALIILDKNSVNGQLAASELNSKYGDNRTVFIKCDIRTDIEQISEKLFETYEHIDILVNNAGVLDEYDPRSVLETNVIGTVEFSIKLWNHMRKDKGGKGGTIMNVASIASFLRIPFMSVYKSSKCAVEGLTKGLGHEYNFNTSYVRVIAVSPGLTYTAMTEQQMVWDEQVEVFNKFRNVSVWQTAEECALGALKVFKEAKSGTVWSVIGGETSEAPDSETVTAEYLYSL